VRFRTLERVGVEVKTFLALRGWWWWWWKLEFSTNINSLELAIVQYGRDTVQFW
jgi:hypothetical protein